MRSSRRFDSEGEVTEDEVTDDARLAAIAHARTELAGVVLLAHPRLIPRQHLELEDPPTGVREIARVSAARLTQPFMRSRTRLPRPLRDRATPPPLLAASHAQHDDDSPTARFELEVPTTRRGTFRTP